jgi:hypothetical protein
MQRIALLLQFLFGGYVMCISVYGYRQLSGCVAETVHVYVGARQGCLSVVHLSSALILSFKISVAHACVLASAAACSCSDCDGQLFTSQLLGQPGSLVCAACSLTWRRCSDTFCNLSRSHGAVNIHRESGALPCTECTPYLHSSVLSVVVLHRLAHAVAGYGSVDAACCLEEEVTYVQLQFDARNSWTMLELSCA